MTNTYTSSLSFAVGIIVFLLCIRKNNKQTKDAYTQTQPKNTKRTKIIQTRNIKTPTKDATTQVEFDIGDFIVVDYCPRV